MSLEERLAELTAALKENTAVQMELLGKVNAASDSDDNADVGEKPVRKRGEPSPGKARRTKAEIAEDDAAEKAEQEDAGGSDENDKGGKDTTSDSDITFDGLKGELSKWLGEFSKKEDKPVDGESDAEKKAREANIHPEVVARKATLKGVLEKLGAKQLPEIKDDQEKIDKLWNWLHEKALKADKGFGIGRLAADPEPAATGGDDDLDI